MNPLTSNLIAFRASQELKDKLHALAESKNKNITDTLTEMIEEKTRKEDPTQHKLLEKECTHLVNLNGEFYCLPNASQQKKLGNGSIENAEKICNACHINNSIKPKIQTNPQSPEKPISQSISSTKTDYQRTSHNELKPPKHPVRIKLNLPEYANPLDAIAFILDKFYTWTPNNSIEVKEYLKKIGPSIKNTQLLMRADNLVDLYERSTLLQIGKSPSFFAGYVDITSSSSYSTYIYGRHTYDKVFQDVNLPLPPELENQRNEIIDNIDQLKESGIFDDLIQATRTELLKERSFKEKLNSCQRAELKLILADSSTLNDPYYDQYIEALNFKPTNYPILTARAQSGG